jgi:hypothetical protein
MASSHSAGPDADLCEKAAERGCAAQKVEENTGIKH